MSARSAGRFLERLLSDAAFGAQLLGVAPTVEAWAGALSSEGYVFSIEELRAVTGPIGGDTLEPEVWLQALVQSATAA